MRHTAVEVYCTVREQRIQRESTFGASCGSGISYIRPAAQISVGHDGSPLSASIHVISIFRTSWQLDNKRSTLYRIYTMHSIQPVEHLQLIKTKNRCLLRNRGLITEDLAFTTWCRKTNGTNGRQRWLAEITWFITQAYTLDMKLLPVVTRRQHGKYWAYCRSQVRVWASEVGLKWPPKTLHLFTLSVIAGTNNQ